MRFFPRSRGGFRKGFKVGERKDPRKVLGVEAHPVVSGKRRYLELESFLSLFLDPKQNFGLPCALLDCSSNGVNMVAFFFSFQT